MFKYLALLRGINVGGKCKVPMSELKKTFEDAGYSHVFTYINSGNVIFEAKGKDIKGIISLLEVALEKKFGFSIKIVIRGMKDIKRIIEVIPDDWSNDKDQKTDILFLWDTFDSKKALDSIQMNKEVDVLKYVKGAIVWHLMRDLYSKSGMHKFIGTELYKGMTARNVNTVRKIYKLMH